MPGRRQYRRNWSTSLVPRVVYKANGVHLGRGSGVCASSPIPFLWAALYKIVGHR